jgi:asparagine synthetase B (glutamine-hydrolysing)
MLDGMFSFVLLDTRDNSFIVARDAIGITPLYIGWGLDGNSLSDPGFSNLFMSNELDFV